MSKILFPVPVSLAACLVVLALPGVSFAATPAAPRPSAAEAAKLLQNAPLRFEPSARTGEFTARGLRLQAAVSANRLAIGMDGHTMQLEFAGASKGASIQAAKPLPSGTNILVGNDRSKWRTAVPNFRELTVTNLYPGIGARYYSEAGQLEYDLLVAPNANPALVKLRFSGEAPVLDADGNLSGTFLQKRPVTYQIADGKRISVPSKYVRHADGTFGISVGSYDRSKELVIDPVLTFSAYLAGSGQDVSYGVGLDSQGFVYVAGITAATDFTLAGGPNQTTLGGSFDLFIAKLDPTPNVDTPLVYSTYLGGANADNLKAMVVSPAGLVYLTGLTASGDFPMAGNSAQTTLSGTTDSFVAVVDPSQPTGSALIYSTFFGGGKDETGFAITYDSKGLIYIAGDTNSTDLPTNNPYLNSLTGTEDMFVAVFDPNQTGTTYATYFGGGNTEYARGIAVTKDGKIWVAGGTYSSDFPIGGAPYNFNYNANCDAFLIKLDPNGGTSGLLYGTFIGGSGQDIAQTLNIDATGRLIVSGLTTSKDFPVTSTAYQTSNAGLMDAFVFILDPSKSPSTQLNYSTYFGGSSNDLPTALAYDAAGIIHLAGYTSSTNLPVTTDALFTAAGGGYDGFYFKLNPTVSGKAGGDYSTYVSGPGTQIVYGVAVDKSSNVFLTGYTTSGVFDSVGGVSKGTAQGDIDGFVMGFSPCGFTLSARSYAFPQAGGFVDLNLTSGKDCPWTSSTSANWVTIAPASGNGPATVRVTAAANTSGAGRFTVISIAGVPFSIAQ